jgi:hypothetical protein
VLLDVLTALEPHLDAIVITGAQAVYLRTGDAGLAVAPYTTDGDLAVDARIIGEVPLLEVAMGRAGLTLRERTGSGIQPGTWVALAEVESTIAEVPIDLLVPQALATRRSRGANLGVHGRRVARYVPGIEAVLIDHSRVDVTALDPDDPRTIVVNVAGSAALFIAKAHKINDRQESGKAHRLVDKDAGDVFRLMQTSAAEDVALTMQRLLGDEMAAASTEFGISTLLHLFGRRGGLGIAMATRALEFALPPESIEAISLAYIERLRSALGRQ